MTTDASRLRLVQTVLDSTDARRLAEFYRSLLDLDYADGDEPPPAGQPDERGRDWLVLRTPDGVPQLAFQQVTRLRAPDWPDGPVPQQLHLDLSVGSMEELRNQHERVLTLGGSLLSNRDRPDPDDEERFRVYRDPEGHPFCIFVAERNE
ncbi:VOC family protein [Streptomyces flaveolus]|uniref:VOC family protein n=1 Tax=Streptomyces flaveolus TaxID=67297 RepID=UPI0033D79115